ncbi:MAG: hypothetical protein H0W16_06090, partial [Actinobacteria bacterium]|nr:hypothetical protein [Actinomycetota bacterium]
MIHFILILGLFLLAIAVTMIIRGATSPGGPSTETLEQIGAYGFAGSLPSSDPDQDAPSLSSRFGDLAAGIGRNLGQRFTRLRGKDYRARLVAAGMYTTTPERLLGTQFLLAVGLAFFWFFLGAVGGMSGFMVVLGAFAAVVLGWMMPSFIVNMRGRK